MPQNSADPPSSHYVTGSMYALLVPGVAGLSFFYVPSLFVSSIFAARARSQVQPL